MTDSDVVLLIDPAGFTPGYDVPLASAIRRSGVRLCFGGPTAVWGEEVEGAEFRFFRVADRIPRQGRMTALLRRALRALEYPIDLVRMMRRVPPSRTRVLHYLWCPMPILDYLVALLYKRRGVPLVLNMFNAAPHAGGSYSGVMLRLIRSADRLIFLTKAVQDEAILRYRLPEAKASVVPRGNSEGFIGRATVEELGPRKLTAGAAVVAVGHIKHYKGIPDLIRAWPLIVAELPTAELVIAGHLDPAADREVRQALDDVGQNMSIRTLFEFLSRERYEEILRTADVLVQPYRSASQSGNTVQAYEFGVPIVCTRVGGLAEMVVDGVTGFTVEPGDLPALATAIVRAVRSNTAGEMSTNCKEFARREFGWDHIATRMVDVYANAVATPG